MNTNKLKKFAQQARIRLLDDVTRRFLYWGITDKGIAEHRVESTMGGYIFRGDVFNDTTVPKKWENLLKAVNNHTANDVVEEASYIWFNRLIAIKILEENGYDDTQLKYTENGIDPIILQNAKRGITPRMDDHAQQQLREYLTNSNDEEALSLLLIHYCKNHSLLNRLFGQIDDYTELLLPNNLLAKDGIISLINNDEFITEEDFKEVELIGWLYQFYISDKKDDVFASFKKKQKARAEDIPAATQIFTPKWIVKYLVENTAGRIWLDKHPDSPIRNTMKYLVDPENAKPSEPIINDVTGLKVLDPAVGSGHFLVVAFELLMPMYIEEGYTRRNAVESIITHNLFGLDLCKRAVGLANFAILLKGASYYPDILRKEIKPQVFAMPEQYDFSPSQISEFLGENGKHYAGELSLALTEMQQAQNIGSALVLKLSDNARKFIQKRLNEWLEKQKQGALDLIELALLHSLQPFLKPILVLTDTYPAVVANPPYMGNGNMNTELKEYLDENYEFVKYDLYSTFIYLINTLTVTNGFAGIIAQQSWMFTYRFKKLREYFIENISLNSVLHLGVGAFGPDFGTAAFCFTKSQLLKNLKVKFYNLSNSFDINVKEYEFLNNKKLIYNNYNLSNFEIIPQKLFTYRLTKESYNLFVNKQYISKVSVTREGLTTGDNDRFLRIWHEISFNKVTQKWFPYVKGGDYRKWYGNNNYLLNWDNSGFEVKNNKTKEGRVRSHNYNGIYGLNEGVTWSAFSSKDPSFRYVQSGCYFDSKGSMLFVNDQRVSSELILGYLNSKVSLNFLDSISENRDTKPGTIANIPFKEVYNSYVDTLYSKIKTAISITKSDWDSNETSWDFEESPLLNNSSSLPKSYMGWEEKVTEDFFKLHENEEELNRIFIDIYGLQDELTPDVALKDVTILQEELDRGKLESRNGELLSAKTRLPIKQDVVIKQLLSYAVGCFMGRYRLDKPGLNIAHPGPTEEELSAYSYHDNTFEIDDDAIIPTMGSDSPFSDDIVARTKEFIQMVWGDESLTENLNFINEALGENIEKYLTKKFWADHKKTYKKKPIYWEFASPNGAFKVIAYMHRMNRFTVQKIRQNYLFKQMNWLEKQIEHLTQNESSLSSKELKTLDNYRKDLIECREYDLILKDMSDRQIDFDLDDGVTENYKLFEGVVSKI